MKMKAGSQLFWTEFLELYKSLPVLWKIKSAEYSNKTLKASAYQQMVEKLKELEPNANRKMIVRKINTFRSNYKRDLKKVKKSQRSRTGAQEVFVPSLWYFNLLSFLDEDEQEDCLKRRLTIDKTETTNLDDESILPPKEKIRKIFKQDENHSKIICEDLKETNNEANVMARAWASQYAELEKQQKILARKIISDVLFHACLGNLNINTVRKLQNTFESLERTSSPLLIDSSCTSSPLPTQFEITDNFESP